MPLNPMLWEWIARERHKELLRLADEERRCPDRPLCASMGRLMIVIGHQLEQVGERLAAKQSDGT